jgi:hypothetical protein
MPIVLDGTAGITYPAGSVGTVASLGDGQTWQAFTVGSQRVSGTTYTNTTGKPIFVYAQGDGNSQSASATVNGVRAAGGATTVTSSTMYFPVPAGASYSVTVSTALAYWSELR